MSFWAVAGQVAAQGAQTGLDLWNHANNQHFAHDEAKLQREWQEDMYKKYESPQAQVKQMREAGVNPFVEGSQAVTGGDVGAGAQAQAPTGNQVHSPLGGILEAVQVENQSRSVDAQQTSAKADADLKAVETAKTLAKEFGDDVAKNYLNSYFAEQYGAFNGRSRADEAGELAIQIARAEKLKATTEADLIDRYGEKKALADLDQTYQWINESAARIGRMIKENEVSDQEIKKMASEIYRNNSAALLDIAKTMTENQMREWIVASLQAESAQKESYSRIVGYQEQEERSTFISRQGVRDYQESPEGQERRTFNYKMSPEGNYMKSLGHAVMEEIPKGSFNTSIGHYGDNNRFHQGDRYTENYINNR